MFGNIENASGENLDYTFHAGDKNSQNIVVLGHGVTGNKDRPFLVELADNLSNAGIPIIRFSFSGNGDSDGTFTQSTISKEIGIHVGRTKLSTITSIYGRSYPNRYSG